MNLKKVSFLFLMLSCFVIFKVISLTSSKSDNVPEMVESMDKVEENIQPVLNEQANYETDDAPKNNVSSNDSIARIIIPKISLDRPLFAKNSSYNNVNRNITILKESTMPDIPNGNFILAAHSGNSNVAYFTNLKDLLAGDIVFIQYQNIQYEYAVYKIVVAEKDGTIEICRNSKDTYLTLITCKLGTNKQYVIICKQINKQKL